jgi:DNA-binding CsgD family transcriptional regulator
VAILSEAANLSLAAALAKLGEDAAVGAARSLGQAAILGTGTSLAFTHPIVRSIVYDSIPHVARERLHREAALALRGAGVPIGVVAAHLLEAERAGDSKVADWLAEAARDAASRGDPAIAVRLLRRALEEPPSPSARPMLLIELARAEAAAGEPTAVDRYNDALALVDDSRHRASLLLELGHALIRAGQWATARDIFERGLGEPGATDPELRGQLEAGYLSACRVTMVRSDEIQARVDRILARQTLRPAERELVVWVAFHLAASVSARADDMLVLVKRAIEDVPIESLVTERQLVEIAAGVLLDTDELELEIDLLTRAMDAAERAGLLSKVGVYSYCRAWPNYFTGRLTDAIADAQSALRAAEVGWEAFYPATVTVLSQALIERGELAAAEQVLSLDADQWGGRLDFVIMLPAARGHLALASGDVGAAIEHFRAASEGAAAIGQRLQVPTDWRVGLAVALSSAGDRVEARRVAGEAVELARLWGARWPLGAALRAAGIAEGGAAGIALLREAKATLDGSPARLEQARALVDLGAALRRHGSLREARTTLTEGMDLARRIGATALLERSRGELRAAGLRPRRYAVTGIDALTPAETRVAALAAGGRTNRQIAQSLFVTAKAVEYHLANAYRKLGISSRHELTLTIARGPDDDSRSAEQRAAGSGRARA